MAPEGPAALVVLTLRFEGEQLKAVVELVERNYDRLYVSWHADTKPEGFFSVGEGTVYVQETTGMRGPSYPVTLDVMGPSRYGWRWRQGNGSIMVVLVLPDSYILTDMQPWPTRAKAIQDKRLAAYWTFETGTADFSFSIKKEPAGQSFSSIVGKINARATRKVANLSNVVVDTQQVGREWGVWVFGAITIIFLMSLIFFGPANLPATYVPIIRLTAALAGGLLSGFFVGKLHLGGRIPGLEDVHIASAGGFAVFVFVMLFWPH
jgi:hypothetical protein